MMSRLDARSVEAATLKLALSERRVYALLHAFRDNPVTASLLPSFEAARRQGANRIPDQARRDATLGERGGTPVAGSGYQTQRGAGIPSGEGPARPDRTRKRTG